LKILDIKSNFLSAGDLQLIFTRLSHNEGLEELYCGNQFSKEVGKEAHQALAETFRTNNVLRKLGMQLLDAHWRDQINRGLVKNVEARRMRRFEEKKRKEVLLAESQARGAEVARDFTKAANLFELLMSERGGA